MGQYDSCEFIERMEAKDLKPELERAAAKCRAVNRATAALHCFSSWVVRILLGNVSQNTPQLFERKYVFQGFGGVGGSPLPQTDQPLTGENTPDSLR